MAAVVRDAKEMTDMITWLHEFANFCMTGGLGALALLVATIAVAALAGFAAGRLSMRARLRSARRDAVKRSRAVLGGQAAEQVAPFLPGFPCNPADARFVGKPVDFVAFPGAADGNGIREVLLIEVKSGDAQLSAREKEIQRAVEGGRVRYVVYHASRRGS